MGLCVVRLVRANRCENRVGTGDLEALYGEACVQRADIREYFSVRSSTETGIILVHLADLINQLSGSVWSFIEITVTLLLMTFLSLASAIYVMQVYDRVIPVNAISTLIVLTVGVVVAVIFEFLARQARAKLTERVSEVASPGALFRRVLNISSQDLQGSIGTLYSHLKQVETRLTTGSAGVSFCWWMCPLTLHFVFFVWLIGGSVVFVPCVLIGILATLSCLFAYLLDKEAVETRTCSGTKKMRLLSKCSLGSRPLCASCRVTLYRHFEEFIEPSWW